MRYLISIFFLFPCIIAAQQPINQRYINWSAPGSQLVDGELIYYLKFQNASYDDLSTLIPKYYELVKLEKNDDYNVILQDLQFEIINPEEISKVKHLESIPSTITVFSSVSYIRKSPFLEVSFIPLRKNPQTNRLEKLISFSLQIRPLNTRKSLSLFTPAMNSYASHSILRTGNWFKISINQDGIYKITYDELKQLGITDPANVRIFGNGYGLLPVMNDEQHPDDLVENSIWFETGADGTFNQGDYILFYGTGPDRWNYDPDKKFFSPAIHKFARTAYYFLTSDAGNGKTIPIEASAAEPATNTVTESDYFLHHESNEWNLIKSGSNWYGEVFDIITSQDFLFEIPDIITTEKVRTRISVLARASDTTNFTVRAGNTFLGKLTISGTNLSHYTATYAFIKTDIFSFYPQEKNVEINLQYFKNTSSAQGWLDYITLNARRKLIMAGNQFHFCDTRSVGPGNTAEFILENTYTDVRIWDITDFNNIRQIETSSGEGNAISFRRQADILRHYVAFKSSGSFLKPVFKGEGLGPVGNQDLHGSGQVDYIIVSHPDFINQARQLAAFRKDHDNLDTLVVTPIQIYNEFSSGIPDVTAIRNFIRMLYDRANSDEEIPRYVLLFGDGSYDNLTLKEPNTNYILTYQSDNSTSPILSFVTDDFFGLLDPGEGGSSGLVDIGIGRFPVSGQDEAQEMVNKTLSYQQPDKQGDWRNTICFIGDDEDGNIHMIQANELADYVESNYPSFVINKIFLDAYQQVATSSGPRYPGVNEAINQQVNKGALIVNYTGHGGDIGLAHEKILEINDIVNWINKDKLPLFMTATCDFSRFDDFEQTSAGELVLLNPRGGGIALLTTTRLVYSGPNHTLNERFYVYVFNKDADGQFYRLGDIIRLAKNTSGSGINKRNFTLLGDPAAVLAYPKYQISALTLNGKPVGAETDTLKALSKATITGQVENEYGDKLENFNGTLYPTVFDKQSSLTTLANDGGTPFTYTMRNRILYKGKATVKNGDFSFSFIVPKDISYNYGYGKMNFYANDPIIDAAGYYSDLIIGGTADSVPDDAEGPDVKVYLNDDNFVFGGITNENPQLLVYVSDSNGINTIGTGIGHDLTAILDNNYNDPILLNDYYEADNDSYQSGKIVYPLRNINQGPHSLKVKVWDVYNNSAEGYTEFTVTSSEDLVLKHVLNYPNPFTTHTSFYFEHNRANADLDVLIQIFTISGKLIKTIDAQITSTGYRCGPFDWDGKDDFGSPVGRGVYIYRVKVHTMDGQNVEKYEKLVILQ